MKQDSLERSQSDLKKLRRKSQGKNASKYESKENEVCVLLIAHTCVTVYTHICFYFSNPQISITDKKFIGL